MGRLAGFCTSGGNHVSCARLFGLRLYDAMHRVEADGCRVDLGAPFIPTSRVGRCRSNSSSYFFVLVVALVHCFRVIARSDDMCWLGKVAEDR